MNRTEIVRTSIRVLLAVLSMCGVAVQATGASPDNIEVRRNRYECQKKAAEYTYNLDPSLQQGTQEL